MTIDEAIESLKSDYEIDMYIRDIAPQLAEWLEELKKYKDSEEQVLLLKLPCKVGDTVWELCKCNDGIYRIFPMVVGEIVIDCYGKWLIDNDNNTIRLSFDDIGQTVFLTKEEAEQKLKGMGGGVKNDGKINTRQ